MFTSKKLLSLLWLGLVPFASLSLIACNSPTSPQAGEERPSPASVAQVEHGSMDHAAMASMDLGPADESFDLRFIDAMIPHHEGAVAMAQDALQKSNRPEIQQLAQAIIEAQEQEIAELKTWRAAWYPDAGEEPMMYSAEMGHMMPMTADLRSAMMMHGDLGDADDQFDRRFIDAMIPHHQGAVDMAQQALEKSDRPEIQTLAQRILDSQQQEIDQMAQWLQDWYAQ